MPNSPNPLKAEQPPLVDANFQRMALVSLAIAFVGLGCSVAWLVFAGGAWNI